jgi:hypothetical protein
MDGTLPWQSALAAMLFAGVFAAGSVFRPLRSMGMDTRSIVSLSGGLSSAYVFVQLMPELAEAQHTFAHSAGLPVREHGSAIYFCALMGFLAFYGLEHLRRMHSGAGGGRDGPEAAARQWSFRIHVGGFAFYVALVSYLLLHGPDREGISLGLYAFAMAAHFLATDHALHHEHGARYRQAGRWYLAAMVLAGWACGLLFVLPEPVLAVLLAFVAGAVIINSAIGELPSEKDGRVLPFVAGALGYGAILWLIA